MEFSIPDWYTKKLSDGNILKTYKGDITPEIITNLLGEIEIKLEEIQVGSKEMKLIYHVMVESLQNLYHHSIPEVGSKNERNAKWALFVLYRNDGKFCLSTGNFGKNSEVNNLKNKIDHLNAMGTDEIKESYVKILNNAQYSEKGGGGLGLIDIKKKTKSNYVYEFYEINENFSFYNLNINIV